MRRETRCGGSTAAYTPTQGNTSGSGKERGR